MFKNYFIATIRNLAKNKTFSFLNIFGLAIGIACAGLIFLWVEDELTFDNFNQKKKNLFEVKVNATFGGNNFTMSSTPRPMAAAIKSEVPGIVNTARYSDQEERQLFSIGEKSMYVRGRYADPGLFSMFSFDFVQGNSNTPFPQLYSLVITESTAKKLFGEEKNVIGKAVRVDNKQDYTVGGVIKDIPQNSSLQFEWIAPYEITLAKFRTQGQPSGDEIDWGSFGPATFVELDGNADLAVINNKLKGFIHQKAADQNKEAFLFPMKNWRLYADFENGKQTGSGRIKQVRMIAVIAWIILLIACINFMNLSTANSQKRAKEVGVRKVLGAGKKGLVTQFMGEAILMSLLATVAAIFIISITLPAFNMLMQKNLALDLTHPAHTLALLTIAVCCGIFAGSYPSLYLSSFKPALVLKGMKLKAGNAVSIRKGLVVVQFTASVVFIITTMIVYLQLKHVKDRNLGFNHNNLIEVRLRNNASKIFPLIKNDLIQTGLIDNVAIADRSTLNGGNTDDRFRWQGKASDSKVSIAHRTVSPEFISVSGMKIAEGRDFTENILSEASNVIINKSLEKIMGNGSAVGKIIQNPRDNAKGVFTEMTVVGVVSDYLYGNMYGQAGPLIIFCKERDSQNYMYVRAKPGADFSEALAKVELVMKKNNPGYPVQIEFVDEQFDRMFQNESLISKISGVFALLAIIISCLGLFGLAAFTAEQKTKEIGIRKVLGASISNITTLISKDFLRLVIIACLIAFPVAWWIMHNWLQNYDYRIGISWWMFLLAGVAATLIALITISFQSIKAAIANPVKSLKAE